MAQFKCTAIIMPNGILKITGIPLDFETFNCDIKISDEKLNTMLNESLKPKKKKTNKKQTTNPRNEQEEEKTNPVEATK